MGTEGAGGAGSATLALLGEDLQAHAGDIAQAVVDWWLHSRRAGEAPDPRVQRDILRTVELGAIATGRFMITGQLPSSDEKERLSAPGKAALTDSIAVDELTKLYLVTRDITCREMTAIAHRRQVDASALDTALAVIRKGSDSAIVGVVRRFDAARRNLQEQLDAERRLLAHHAVHDGLTGLPNRTLFMDRLEQLLPAGRPPRRVDRRRCHLAVLFIDVDRFKVVNDVAGHRVGDELLVAAAARLRSVIRENDTLARLGGDEFVVVCPELAEAAAEAAVVAERITAVMAEPFFLEGAGEEFLISASVGIAVASPDDSAESVLSRADAAMYSAKRRGGSSHEIFDEVPATDGLDTPRRPLNVGLSG
jgi:diguanylate cyclase (GGDEF)-like protein